MLDINENTQLINNEFDHLIRLLDDEDEGIYSSVKERFISYGEDSSRFLKKYLQDENILLQKRANEIVSILNFDSIQKKFNRLMSNEKEEILENGMFLLSAFEYPAVKVSDYKRKLDKMSLQIESSLFKIKNDINEIDPLRTLKTINNYLFKKKGFRGNTENYYEPDNSYLNRVLDTKLGIPISLSVVYILISRRLNLPVHGINLPGHFIIKYSGSDDEFFIDPFNNGVIISQKEASEFFSKIGMAQDYLENVPFLKRASDKETILRVMRNLIDIYKKRAEPLKADRLETLTQSLT